MYEQKWISPPLSPLPASSDHQALRRIDPGRNESARFSTEAVLPTPLEGVDEPDSVRLAAELRLEAGESRLAPASMLSSSSPSNGGIDVRWTDRVDSRFGEGIAEDRRARVDELMLRCEPRR